MRCVYSYLRLFSRLAVMGILLMGATGLHAQQTRQRVNGNVLTVQEQISTGVNNFNLVVNNAVTVQTPVDVFDVTVGNPGIVSVAVSSPRKLVLSGQATGSTNVSLFDGNGSPVAQYYVDVTPDLRNLQAYIERLIPNASISVDYMNNSILLTGSASSVADIKRAGELASLYSGTSGGAVYNDISLSTNNQVSLKVTIVELSRNVIKKLGIELTSVGGTGIERNNPSVLGYTLDSAINGTAFKAQLDALESAGYVRTLADTVVTALSGEKGSVHSGGQIRVPTSDGNYDYKDYGVLVDIVPTIIGPGLINLDVSAETSSVDTSSQLAGSLLTRKANTKVEMGSGKTMMIAGLIQHEQSDSNAGVPLLKSIPIIGQLFRRRDFSDTQKELVVLVTPYLVRGTKHESFETPTDNFIPTDDLSSFVNGSLDKNYRRLPPVSDIGQSNIYGFMNN